MMIYAWNGYRKYAWGKNEVRPIALKPFNQGIFGGASSNMAATIVDALDTLWIMGLREQFDQVLLLSLINSCNSIIVLLFYNGKIVQKLIFAVLTNRI